ncbi:hypothetical protein G7K_5729-t2 [Saitoella complicata NRRL Y-17804]|uniref:Uncharacterized protein n=1 Tax=Saitoella complicata (strain BCRC 22490 / CBS 7301 / JCM 7358 / NBRC 10748 / NRRL Y-17804) TaxID=698492 RepID=A0A0E9NP71_SAICN|nr:hypothetical protein G7K_5729-t2 [Saitoella complicata NRRL Y-17804]
MPVCAYLPAQGHVTPLAKSDPPSNSNTVLVRSIPTPPPRSTTNKIQNEVLGWYVYHYLPWNCPSGLFFVNPTLQFCPVSFVRRLSVGPSFVSSFNETVPRTGDGCCETGSRIFFPLCLHPNP